MFLLSRTQHGSDGALFAFPRLKIHVKAHMVSTTYLLKVSFSSGYP